MMWRKVFSIGIWRGRGCEVFKLLLKGGSTSEIVALLSIDEDYVIEIFEIFGTKSYVLI